MKGSKGIKGSRYTRVRIYGLRIIRDLITIIQVTYFKHDYLF
jgi:hypothetical protein